MDQRPQDVKSVGQENVELREKVTDLELQVERTKLRAERKEIDLKRKILKLEQQNSNLRKKFDAQEFRLKARISELEANALRWDEIAKAVNSDGPE